jgi:hypothetical protein
VSNLDGGVTEQSIPHMYDVSFWQASVVVLQLKTRINKDYIPFLPFLATMKMDSFYPRPIDFCDICTLCHLLKHCAPR